MSFLTKFVPRLLTTIPKCKPICYDSASDAINPGGWFSVSIRNVMRCHFPKPSEQKRIKRHGWKKRMSTPAGRRIIMNRILKGSHILSH